MKHCPSPSCDHLARHGLVSEFLDEVDVCSDCGSALAPGEAPEVQGESPAFRELVTIYRAADSIRAHLLKGVLQSEGIPVDISGEALMGAVGELPVTMLDVEVKVPPEFAVQARQTALEWERGLPDEGPSE